MVTASQLKSIHSHTRVRIAVATLNINQRKASVILGILIVHGIRPQRIRLKKNIPRTAVSQIDHHHLITIASDKLRQAVTDIVKSGLHRNRAHCIFVNIKSGVGLMSAHHLPGRVDDQGIANQCHITVSGLKSQGSVNVFLTNARHSHLPPVGAVF